MSYCRMLTTQRVGEILVPITLKLNETTKLYCMKRCFPRIVNVLTYRGIVVLYNYRGSKIIIQEC